MSSRETRVSQIHKLQIGGLLSYARAFRLAHSLATDMFIFQPVRFSDDWQTSHSAWPQWDSHVKNSKYDGKFFILMTLMLMSSPF